MRRGCLILIDGSNFYFKLKDLKLHNLLEFDFNSFAKFLAKKDKIVGSNYYVGKIKQDGSARIGRLHADQQKLFENLKVHGFKYVLGYLLKSDGKFHEKGVDVHIAVDILTAVYEKLANRIILVSSDTDLEPAIQIARSKKMKVEYVGFSHMPSAAMIRFCTSTKLLTKKDIEKFTSKKRTVEK